MDLHEHLRLARSKIKPLTKEQRKARSQIALKARWDKWRLEHESAQVNPAKIPTSAPRISTENPK